MSAEESFDHEAVQTIVTFLKSNVMKTDAPNIHTELKKNFVLCKRKGKESKRIPKKKRKQGLTRAQKQQLGFFNLSGSSVKYKDVVIMNHLWNRYMEQLLELHKPIPACSSKNWESFTQSIYKADFHGSFLKVIRSKCPSYVDKMGICIMDTKNIFKIVSSNNVVLTIPKKCSVFELHLKKVKITLFGKHLCHRPAERSTKKIKGHFHPDL